MSTRISYDLPGMLHTNPIPIATRKGPLVVSGGIAGMDPATGAYLDGIDAQVEKMFENIREVMRLAGGTPEDIVKMTVWRRSGKPINDSRLSMNARLTVSSLVNVNISSN